MANSILRHTYYKPIYLDSECQIIGGWITTNPKMLDIYPEYRPQLVYSEFEIHQLPQGSWTEFTTSDNPLRPDFAVLTW